MKLLALFAFLLMAAAPMAHAEVAIGQAAPAFTGTDSNGTSHSLSDFAGKIVVLEWHNDGCPYVEKYYNAGAMQALQEKYTGQDVVWLTVTSSAEGEQGYHSPEDTNALIEKQGAKATARLIDADGTIGQAYGAKTTPHMYVIDAEGNLAYMGAIDDKNSTNPESLEGATNYVANAIDALKAGEPVEPSVTQPYGCSVKYKG